MDVRSGYRTYIHGLVDPMYSMVDTIQRSSQVRYVCTNELFSNIRNQNSLFIGKRLPFAPLSSLFFTFVCLLGSGGSGAKESNSKEESYKICNKVGTYVVTPKR